MAQFSGTTEEFKRYIGPRLRNVVNTLTRRQRDAVGACEHCGSTANLESAHVHGRDRTQIIEMLLATADPSASHTVDLNDFERRFVSEHEPFEKAILVLCHDCHTRYDRGHVLRGRPSRASSAPRISRSLEESDFLPITLDPADPDAFKRDLLRTQAAMVEIHMADGSVERKPWNASRFTASSNVMGNLRSRPDFRQGEWQQRGIVKVHVTVSGDA